MKQIIYQILVCCLIYTQCFGISLIGSGITPSVSCTCEVTVYESSTGGTSGDTMNRSSAEAYGGIFYTPTDNIDLCQYKFYPKSVTGDVSAKTYKATVYALSGTTLITSLGSSTGLTGNNLWDATTPLIFDFPSVVNLVGSTQYAIVIWVDNGGSPAYDSSNYLTLGYSATGGTPTNIYAIWREDKTKATSSTDRITKWESFKCQ